MSDKKLRADIIQIHSEHYLLIFYLINYFKY